MPDVLPNVLLTNAQSCKKNPYTRTAGIGSVPRTGPRGPDDRRFNLQWGKSRRPFRTAFTPTFVLRAATIYTTSGKVPAADQEASRYHAALDFCGADQWKERRSPGPVRNRTLASESTLIVSATKDLLERLGQFAKQSRLPAEKPVPDDCPSGRPTWTHLARQAFPAPEDAVEHPPYWLGEDEPKLMRCEAKLLAALAEFLAQRRKENPGESATTQVRSFLADLATRKWKTSHILAPRPSSSIGISSPSDLEEELARRDEMGAFAPVRRDAPVTATADRPLLKRLADRGVARHLAERLASQGPAATRLAIEDREQTGKSTLLALVAHHWLATTGHRVIYLSDVKRWGGIDPILKAIQEDERVLTLVDFSDPNSRAAALGAVKQ